MLIAQRWVLGTAAILTRLNQDPPYVFGGGLRSDPGAVKVARDVLARSWDVKDATSFVQTVAWLRDSGHSNVYDARVRELAHANGPIQPRDEEHAHHLQFAQQMQGEIGRRSLLAWDAARLVLVAGWGYVAGYVEEREAWSMALGAAVASQRAYGSWAEFGAHYVLGHAFWGGGKPENTKRAYDELVAADDSPYRSIPWDTPLWIPGVEAELGARWHEIMSSFPQRALRPTVSPLRSHPGYPPEVTQIRWVDGAALVRREGRLTWDDHHETAMERDLWPDEWGPLSPAQWDFATPQQVLVRFMAHEHELTRLNAADGEQAERRLLELGYRSVGQFFRVHHTMAKYFGTPGGSWLAFSAFEDLDCNQAILDAHRAGESAAQRSALAAAPELTAPIDGVTLEALALLSAHQTAGTKGQAWAQLLAHHGLDEARFIAASRAWGQRLQGEGRLGPVYAGMYAEQLKTVNAERAARGEGPPPLTFEKYCEVGGAMAAWGQNGVDMNAEIERVFGMTMVDFCSAGLEWGNKVASDVALLGRYMALIEQFTVQYGGTVDAGGSSDDGEPEEEEEPEEPDDDDDDDDDDDED